MNLLEKMTSEKIKDNTYMIWIESGLGYGPCSLYAGACFGQKNFQISKNLLRKL